MSGKLAMRVWESGLPRRLKETANMVALFAFDDGTSIFPSVDRLAWLMGKHERRVREDLSKLRTLGVLVPITPIRVHEKTGAPVPVGGRYGTTEYRFVEMALPAQDAWRPRKGERRSTRNHAAGGRVSTQENPAAAVHKRVPFQTGKGATSGIRSVRDQSVPDLSADVGVPRSGVLVLPQRDEEHRSAESPCSEKKEEPEDFRQKTLVRMREIVYGPQRR